MKNRYAFTPITVVTLFMTVLLMLIATACGGGGSSTAPG